ncbi:unnamed protein product [Symbiodinium sp. CCMP2592]|nr:unnamed protein product [Symbiodinium sp. CCMP2592]
MSVAPASADADPSEDTKAADDPPVAGRVRDALRGANNFGEFRSRRRFVFVHLFSGERDILGETVKAAAKAEGLNVDVRSVDIKGTERCDLSKAEPFGELMQAATDGNVDAGHAGPPCGTFSRVRWNEKGTGPPPVRGRLQIYGLDSNNEVLDSQKRRKVPEAGTLENPPGSQDGPDGSMWLLPEVMAFEKEVNAIRVSFNTCAYQMGLRNRWWKPSTWAGRLEDIETLSASCTCPPGFRHEKLVGRVRTSESAEYPKDLCIKYAALLVKAFKKTLQLEWWRSELRCKKEMVSQLQVKWLESKEKQLSHQQTAASQTGRSKRVWSARAATVDIDPDKRVSKKARRELENVQAVGGMRNPHASMSRLGKVAEVGRDIARLWRRFAQEHPEALEVAKTYGSKDCQPDLKIAEAWKDELKLLLKVKEEPGLNLKENIEFTSPLDPAMWRAWQRASADPEKHIAEWANDGAPLGMGKEIPSSAGVFPEVETASNETPEMPTLEWQAKIKNYTSMFEDPEGASAELGRYLDKGFCKRMSKKQATRRFDRGTISKLALITKQKGENVVKRRIIIDLLRSGGNKRARVPERIILPRGSDVIAMMKKLWQLKGERATAVDPLDNIGEEPDGSEDPGIEIVGADLSDAYCHFPVARKELSNCLAPGLEEEEIIIFCAMLFGFKAAPLIMGRLSAALARLWQSMIMRDGALQLYMDDPLFAILGPLNRRRGIIAMLLYTAMAMGINLAFHKGERGLRVKWIGIAMELNVSEATFTLSIPKKVAAEILEKIQEWKGKGMISLRELRATTGRLSWVAGIVPRLRWAVSILYAVVADVEAAEAKGTEADRELVVELTIGPSSDSCP